MLSNKTTSMAYFIRKTMNLKLPLKDTYITNPINVIKSQIVIKYPQVLISAGQYAHGYTPNKPIGIL